MRTAALILALLLPGCAGIETKAEVAAHVVAPDGALLVLYKEPCKILKLEPPWQTAEILNGDKLVFTGCWAAQPPVIYLKWEDGDIGVLPIDAFTPGPSNKRIPRS